MTIDTMGITNILIQSFTKLVDIGSKSDDLLYYIIIIIISIIIIIIIIIIIKIWTILYSMLV